MKKWIIRLLLLKIVLTGCVGENILTEKKLHQKQLQGILIKEKPQQGQLNLSSKTSPFSFIEDVGKSLQLNFKDKPIWQYKYGLIPIPTIEEYKSSNAFLHPVWSPNGAIVTDFGPPDFPYYRGIFFAFSETQWDNLSPQFFRLPYGTGRIRFEAFERLELYPEKAVMVSRHIWQANKGNNEWVPVIKETWTIITYAPKTEKPDYWIFDLTTELLNISDKPFIAKKYYKGGLIYRGARAWYGNANQREILTSKGRVSTTGKLDTITGATGKAQDKKKLEVSWIMEGGIIDGNWAGLTIMDHPTNPSFPTAVGVGENVGFTSPHVMMVPVQKTDITFNPNKPLSFKYRIIVHASKPTLEQLEEIWDQFQKIK